MRSIYGLIVIKGKLSNEINLILCILFSDFPGLLGWSIPAPTAPPRRRGPGPRPETHHHYHLCTIPPSNIPPHNNLVSDCSGSDPMEDLQKSMNDLKALMEKMDTTVPALLRWCLVRRPWWLCPLWWIPSRRPWRKPTLISSRLAVRWSVWRPATVNHHRQSTKGLGWWSNGGAATTAI